jgi:hypothetical protein
MEVADRPSLRAIRSVRDIQLAMLPAGMRQKTLGLRRDPAGQHGGGDFYDVIPLPDGRLALAVGDVAGKGSRPPCRWRCSSRAGHPRRRRPETARLIERLNVQVAKHSPASRFITFFFGCRSRPAICSS